MMARLHHAVSLLALAGAMGLGVLLPLPASGQAPVAGTPDIFREVDLALGEQLVREHRCADCHVRKFGGDGSSIYRPQGRINSAPLLRGMVQLCSTELNLSLFPEEVTAIAAVLNRDHYRFK
jgi:hypothetical protein